jgi:hypothetical protein
VSIEIGDVSRMPIIRTEVNPVVKKKKALKKAKRAGVRKSSAKPKKPVFRATKKESSMKHRKKSGKKRSYTANPGKRRVHRRRHVARASNPAPRRVRRYARRRSNPGIRRSGWLNRLTGQLPRMARDGVFAAGGMFGAKEITQMMLGTSNRGLVGYATQFAVGLGLSLLAGMVGNQRDAIATGTGVVLGVGQRVMSERANPALALNGIGDVTTFAARSTYKQRLRGLNEAQMQRVQQQPVQQIPASAGGGQTYNWPQFQQQAVRAA